MEQRRTALVLCGIAPHIEFMRRLQERGYRAVLVDYLENPPAARAADVHVRESAFESDAVRRVALEYHADFIAAPCIDQVNIVACEVSEELGLPRLYSPAVARMVTDKALMKRMLLEHDIPTARGVAVDVDDDPFRKARGLEYPLMAKPTDGYASVGVSKVEAPEELAAAVLRAREASRGGEVILEEFLTGRELSAYCFVTGGAAELVLCSDRFTYRADSGVRCYATVSPAQISEPLRDEIRQTVQRVVDQLGLVTSPFFIQFFHDGRHAKVTEFAGRAGGGFSYTNMRNMQGFDMFSAIIDAYEGRVPDVSFHDPERLSLIQLVYADYGVYDHLEGMDKLLEEGVVDEFHLYKERGDEITPAKPARARVGTAVLYGNSIDDLVARADRMMSGIDVVGADGCSMLLRDVRLGPEAYGPLAGR